MIVKRSSPRLAARAATESAASIPGRGEDDKKVREWLTTAAMVPGFIGFAVGRTTFWEPPVEFRAQKISRETAVARIAASYRLWVDLFERGK
jgi:5-dehydro-2-deoxygluconokinase